MPEIVVDLDGPILDVAARHFAVYCELAKDLNFAALPFETYWERKRTPLGARRILESTGSAAAYPDFARRWLHEIELDDRLKMDTLQAGAVASLDRWRTRGHRLVLATMRQDAGALARQLRALELDRRFDTVVVCDRKLGGVGKASAVAARLGPAPAGSYWIGDTEIDVTAARERGSAAWAVSCGLRDATYLAAQRPDRLGADLASLEPFV